MTDQPKRIAIDAPSEMTILAARHLDATEARVQVGATVDTATRSAITQVLRYVSTAHNAPAATAEAERDGAYRERAHLVAWLAALHPAVIAPAPDVDEPGWQILYLYAGSWQMSWHIAPRDAELFSRVEHVDTNDRRAQWDGHTTDAKYTRIRQHTRVLQLRGQDPYERCICSSTMAGLELCARCPGHDQPDDTDLAEDDVDHMMATGTPVQIVTKSPPTFATEPNSSSLEFHTFGEVTGSTPLICSDERHAEKIAALTAERDTARQHAAAIAAQRDRLRMRMNALADRWDHALAVDKPYARTLRAEISVAPFDPDGAMTVQEYTERGRHLWAFRCWGTDTCDGWLGLGHHTQTSALLERERHVAEAHAAHDCPGIGQIQLSRQLGRGVIVDEAPQRALIGLHIVRDLAWPMSVAAVSDPDLINVADQVLYRVVGYDPGTAALIVELVEDWRPKAKEQP